MERYRLGSNIIRASEVLHSNRHIVAWVIVDVLSYADVWQSRPSYHGKDEAQFYVILTRQLRRDSQLHSYLPQLNLYFAIFPSFIVITHKIISALSLKSYRDYIFFACSF